MTGHDLKVHCIRNFVVQSSKAKIIKVPRKNGVDKVTVRNARAYERRAEV